MAKSRGFQQLGAIIAKVHGIAQGDLARQSVERIGHVLHDLALEGLQAGRNPRGRAWKGLADGGGVALRNAPATLQEAVSSLMAGLTVSFPHALAHQAGAKKPLVNVRTGKALSLAAMKRLSTGQAKALVQQGALQRPPWKLPARSMLPSGGRLPPAWAAKVSDAMRQMWGAWWE